MKKYMILISIICLFYNCKSISNVDMLPLKDKKVGNIGGKIEVTNDKYFWNLKYGTHKNDIKVMVRNIKTKKLYQILSKNGYYFFYNLPEGDYTFFKWQIHVPVNDINTYLENEIKNFNFTIEDKKFKTMKSLIIRADIPKEFTFKINYFTNFEDEDLEDIKAAFVKKDPKGYWKDFEWVMQSLPSEIEQQTSLTDSQIADNYVSTSDSDFYNMEQLYKKRDYYLSFMLFHRIITNLLDAGYVRKFGKEIPITDDLTELAKKAGIELKAEHLLLINDLNIFNDRIKKGDTDDKFKTIFTKEYFEKYLSQVNDLIKYLKELKYN